VAGAHDEGRTCHAPGQGSDDRVAPAVGIEHVKAPRLQDLADGGDALQIGHRPLHIDGMHGETGIPQTLSQLRARLADRFDMMPARPHGMHFLENSSFLSTKGGGGFRMHDT